MGFNIINFKVLIRRGISFYIFCALLYPTLSFSINKNIILLYLKNQEWKVVKIDKNEEPTWTIYKREISGTNFLEYKIEGLINSSPKACVSAFRKDLHSQADGMNLKKFPTYNIVYETSDSLLTYVIHKEPFPLKNTEMSVRYLFSGTNEVEEVKWTEAWDEVSAPEPSKKFNRIETFRGAWNFRSISSDITSATTSVQFDPKKMPMWLVEPMVFKFLKEGLSNLRALTLSLK